ncbi:metallophosphoesterase [Anoxybacillus sp. J5B_2022]|uniref:metallophosphoesterase n=1 Tax=Anoxybacillus sp. J5B_2022 TaxID=3003246 RepID=UPI002285FDF9|nr:metallophosphoesterase [Anoxybacillus sp. J5B_2022]MCZ0754272.1 metallophosphoesterase [Anoxybacillus sp. J5B_2022]
MKPVMTMTRRTFLQKSIASLLGGIAITSFGYYYARFIEPKRLTVTNHTIYHPLIPKSFDGIKIVQFSDTHLGYHFSLAELRHIVNRINDLQPDIVFFTGDLMDKPNQYHSPHDITPILAKIRAPLGKFCIYGNHDHGGYGTDLYRKIMTKAGFRMLVNEHMFIEQIDRSKIAIVGADDLMLGKPDFEKMFQHIPPSTYTILLLHEPDGANEAARYRVHLQLSGHSHGGQIQLPFIGPLVTPPLAVQYYEGFYQIQDMTLYVNRGLGTTRMPFRFLTPPELTVFTLKHEPPSS